ncbi:MAG: type II toxin-antitoxin system RelE/ParE family toxin [Pseudomonadales bacterium]
MKLEFHPDTVGDLNDAVEFYERQQIGLGSELREEIFRTIDRIVADPHFFRAVRSDIRRCLAHRFPFSVLFRVVDPDTIRVLVIRHHRQRPELGEERR